MEQANFIQDLAVILAVAGVVGWACQRVGLSSVVGFLIAGIVVGPFTPPFVLVTDESTIKTAADIGLVFLMFSIGLKLSVRKLRRLGLSLIVTVFATAGIVFYLSKLMGAALGLDGMQSLFLAAMLMVSSSAIISKVLSETGVSHQRFGQLAMGISVLEDVVAVVMLTLLNSLITYGAGGFSQVATTLGLLGAFVVLAVVVGLLIVPWLLRKMSIAADEELQTLGIAGLLFALAILAQRAGYSPALGAFLIGTIVAETPHRHQIERTFAGMRDVFSAVFFVAIGMQIDIGLLVDTWWVILAVGAFTLIARPLAATLGLVLAGNQPRESVQAGLAVTPIGEFSFIIAQMGVAAKLLPDHFYPLAVGVCLVTTLTAPFMTRRSEGVSEKLMKLQPRWMETWLRYYADWLDRVQERRRRNLLWQLSRKRFIQIGVEVLVVTGLLVFSEQILAAFEGYVGPNWLFLHGPAVIFWVGLSLLVLAPLIAIWRNASALSMLYAEVATSGHPRRNRLKPMVEMLMKFCVAIAMIIWLSSFLPVGGAARWVMLASVLVAAGGLLLMKRKLVYWHSELEFELQDILTSGATDTVAPWLRPHQEWQLSVAECTLPDLSDAQGKAIAELDLRARTGCTVVGIERQGCMISLPAPSTVLYPRDKILLMGDGQQLAAGKQLLGQVTSVAMTSSDFDEVCMESVPVPAGSPLAGQTLRELSPARQYAVQIAGIHRYGQRMLNPGADEKLFVGDELLTLGTPAKIAEFRDALEAPSSDEKS